MSGLATPIHSAGTLSASRRSPSKTKPISPVVRSASCWPARRIYIGRRFKNDTERLEKLCELYTKMIANGPAAKKETKKAERRSLD